MNPQNGGERFPSALAAVAAVAGAAAAGAAADGAAAETEEGGAEAAVGAAAETEEGGAADAETCTVGGAAAASVEVVDIDAE